MKHKMIMCNQDKTRIILVNLGEVILWLKNLKNSSFIISYI